VIGVERKLAIEPVSLFAGDADRGHHRRDQDQHEHDGGRNALINAFERLIVAEAFLDIDGQGPGLREVAPGCLIGQIGLRQPLHIAARRLGAERHRAIEPCRHLGLLIGQEILAEVRRDLERELQLSALQTLLEFGFARNLPMFGEIPGARKVFEQFPALGRLILVEGGVGEMFDIERDAVTDGQHQDQRAEERKGEPDRIAQDFQRLPPCISP